MILINIQIYESYLERSFEHCQYLNSWIIEGHQKIQRYSHICGFFFYFIFFAFHKNKSKAGKLDICEVLSTQFFLASDHIMLKCSQKQIFIA